MKKIAIIGSGDLGKSIAWYATQNNFLVVGFYDDYQTNKEIDGHPVLGTQKAIVTDFNYGIYDALVCAVGYNHFHFREEVFKRYHIECGIPFATIIDQSCHIDASATIGEGVVMFPTAMVDKGCVIEDNVLLNVGVTIAHDSTVKCHSFLSPRVAMAGFSTIGKRCMIGINSTIIDHIQICDDVRVGGGNLVIKNIEKPGLYVGSPVKRIKD